MMHIGYVEEPGTRPSYMECVQLALSMRAIEDVCWARGIPAGPVRVFSAPITIPGPFVSLHAVIPPHIVSTRKARKRWWRRG